MTTRRGFFKWLGASAVVPGQVMAQEAADEPPKCSAYLDVTGKWRILVSVENTSEFNKGEAPASTNWYLVTRAIGSRHKRFEGLAIEEVKGGWLRIQPHADGGLGAKINMARLYLKSDTKESKTVGDDILLGRKVHLDFYFDQSTQPDARLSDVSSFTGIEISRMNDAFRGKLMTAKILYLNFVVRDFGTIQMALRVEGLREALDRAPALVAEQVARIAAAGKCQIVSPCMMTTAAVGMLGRSDDCFELRQMRRLRAVFGHERPVLEDYLSASAAVLARLPSRRVAARIMAFYVAVVWPTALLARAGALRGARWWYLRGFALLMGRLAR